MEVPPPHAANAPLMSQDFRDVNINPRCSFISEMNYFFKP